MTRFATISLGCALLCACSSETTDSNLIKTKAIWSDIYVTSNGQDSRVIAELNVSSKNGNNLNLVAGDKLSVTATQFTVVNGTDAVESVITKDMHKDVDIFDIDYRATLPFNQEDTEYEIQFYRADDKETLTSIVTLPQPMVITSPQQGQVFPVDEVLELSWEQAAVLKGHQPLHIYLESSCKNGSKEITNTYVFNDVEDNGQKNIDFNSINIFKNDELNSSFNCKVKFEFERRRYGTVDDRYASGSRAYAKTHATLENIQITLK
ncbi:hypothetical protein HG263_04855 [Pseudoalteromonas sp. JBTF-M23]|uniref:Lipoprotein n=1 Tax=Pseudoalteromonas caenipelagi TaxID=2726988 RepID=A0A849VD56_9GAMM|nr:hypothetical protein [Pseudoalteromonas caenipelagi]NOU49864.1 hypothetical protein [Pseudoalteromonas caenipelagi]